MTQHPIEHHGVIGDMHTAALVDVDGTVDWLCLPRFDSPSVFASLLDSEKGGSFALTPRTAASRSRQHYWPDTNVLVTRFVMPDGAAQVVDFMPVGDAAHSRYRTLVRRVRGIRGKVGFRMACRPAFDYARQEHRVELEPHGACFRTDALHLSLSSPVALKENGPGVEAQFEVGEGEHVTFVLRTIDAGAACIAPPPEETVQAHFEQTVRYWRGWLERCTYAGRWREAVHRSVLALKLLTYAPSGAIVAAPTTSLPETLGGERNWDYRYTWVRDAAFTVYALLRVGFAEEAAGFMSWLTDRCHELEPDGSLRLVYGIDGRHDLPEETLDHLAGYRGSRPVRIGNGAHRQLQLDIYGELLDSIYLYNKYGAPISWDLWKHLRRMIGWVCDHWQEPDEGIWEVRSGRRQFVYSKLMCWVALDRAIRLADKRSFPADRARWLAVRDAIYENVMAKGWNAERRAFVQCYGGKTLDAANLIMPLVFFLAPNDPRMLATLDATLAPRSKGGLTAQSLVYRYDANESDDGLHGEEGSFNLCTFWLVEALTRAGRTNPRLVDRARLLFEDMLGYANPLGLYAEQTGPSGESLGNFPQAFTHIAQISAAFNLDRALGAPHYDPDAWTRPAPTT